jgi:hypothetical protein
MSEKQNIPPCLRTNNVGDEPRILSVRRLFWPVSASVLLPSAKGIVRCVVPHQPARCVSCGAEIPGARPVLRAASGEGV